LLTRLQLFNNILLGSLDFVPFKQYAVLGCVLDKKILHFQFISHIKVCKEVLLKYKMSHREAGEGGIIWMVLYGWSKPWIMNDYPDFFRRKPYQEKVIRRPATRGPSKRPPIRFGRKWKIKSRKFRNFEELKKSITFAIKDKYWIIE